MKEILGSFVSWSKIFSLKRATFNLCKPPSQYAETYTVNSTICSSFSRKEARSQKLDIFSWVTSSTEALILWKLSSCCFAWRLNTQLISLCWEATMRLDKLLRFMGFMTKSLESMEMQTLGNIARKSLIISASAPWLRVRSYAFMVGSRLRSSRLIKRGWSTGGSKSLMKGLFVTWCGPTQKISNAGRCPQEVQDGFSEVE